MPVGITYGLAYLQDGNCPTAAKSSKFAGK
jgi:hypothetical protein